MGQTGKGFGIVTGVIRENNRVAILEAGAFMDGYVGWKFILCHQGGLESSRVVLIMISHAITVNAAFIAAGGQVIINLKGIWDVSSGVGLFQEGIDGSPCVVALCFGGEDKVFPDHGVTVFGDLNAKNCGDIGQFLPKRRV